MAEDKTRYTAFLHAAHRKMMEANEFAGAMVWYFHGTAHQAEAEEHARLVADSAVDAAMMTRKRASSEQVDADMSSERNKAEAFVKRYFADVGHA